MVMTLNMSSATRFSRSSRALIKRPVDVRIARLRDEWLDGFKSAETTEAIRGVPGRMPFSAS